MCMSGPFLLSRRKLQCQPKEMRQIEGFRLKRREDGDVEGE